MAIQLLKASNQSVDVTGYKGIGESNPRSVSFWIKGTFASLDQLFYWGTEASGQRWQLFEQTFSGTDNIGISFFSSFRAWLKGNMFDGNWHLFIVTSADSSASNINAYLDNVAMTIKQTGGPTPINTGNTTNVTIGDGNLGGWNSSNITILDFLIHSKVLSGAEMTAMFDNGNGCNNPASGLENELRFGAESGLLVQETDLSGNGRDGFPVNAPSYVADPFSPCGPIGRPIANKYNFKEYGGLTCH